MIKSTDSILCWSVDIWQYILEREICRMMFSYMYLECLCIKIDLMEKVALVVIMVVELTFTYQSVSIITFACSSNCFADMTGKTVQQFFFFFFLIWILMKFSSCWQTLSSNKFCWAIIIFSKTCTGGSLCLKCILL